MQQPPQHSRGTTRLASIVFVSWNVSIARRPNIFHTGGRSEAPRSHRSNNNDKCQSRETEFDETQTTALNRPDRARVHVPDLFRAPPVSLIVLPSLSRPVVARRQRLSSDHCPFANIVKVKVDSHSYRLPFARAVVPQRRHCNGRRCCGH